MLGVDTHVDNEDEGCDMTMMLGNCPHCDQELEIPTEMQGQTIQCPTCNEDIELPSPEPASPLGKSRTASQQTRPKKRVVTRRRESISPTKPCPYCGEAILRSAQKCKHCGEFLNASAKTHAKSKSGAQGKVVASIVIFVVIIGFLGNFHFVKGSSVIGFKLVSRSSFGFSEMVVDVDKITSMPLIAAQSRFPLGVAACQRAGIIETRRQFEHRTRQEFEQEFKEEYRKQMENVEEEAKRLMDAMDL